MVKDVRRSVPRGATRSSSSPDVKVSSPTVGAKRQKTSLGDLWRAYQAHHIQTASDSLLRLLKAPLQTALTFLVVAIALTLPATLYVAVGNVQSVGDRWDSDPRMTLFLHKNAREVAIDRLLSDLRSNSLVSSVELVSPEVALNSFAKGSGVAEAISALGENPLPHSIVLTLQSGSSRAGLQSLMQQQLDSALVDDVLLDQAWIDRLQQILRLAEQLALLLGLLLLTGVILVVGNTLRLAIESRRDEIVIIKLVGATDAFVRRPFLYTGFWYGFGGGVLALLLLSASLSLLADPVSRLAGLYDSDYQLAGLGLQGSLSLMLLSIAIGWLGALLAVGRHLDDIRPQ